MAQGQTVTLTLAQLQMEVSILGCCVSGFASILKISKIFFKCCNISLRTTWPSCFDLNKKCKSLGTAEVLVHGTHLFTSLCRC